MLKLTTPQERGRREHLSLLRAPPNWGPYEILIWLPSPVSSGDGSPAINSLCDLVQVTLLLCASLSLSVKRRGWTSWNLGSILLILCSLNPFGWKYNINVSNGHVVFLTSSS